MGMQEWEKKVKAAKCPDAWTYELIGFNTGKGIEDTELRFYPGMSNIDDLNTIEGFCYANIFLHSYGIRFYIEQNHDDSKNEVEYYEAAMTNEQIVDIDLVPYDDYVTYKKSLGNYMAKGGAIAAVANTGLVGVAVGVAIGAVASIGNKTEHIKGKYLRITFWDRQTKELKYILLDHPKQKLLEKFVENWNNEKKINEETGRKPTDKSQSSGCLSVIVLVIVSTILCSFVLL